jgi:hypothetical protein
MVLTVVDFHGACIDVGFQSIVGVWKGWEFKSHDPFLIL